MPGNDTYEQLKAAKAYLASKLQDAQQRMQTMPEVDAASAEEPQDLEGLESRPAWQQTPGTIADAAPSRPVTSSAPTTADDLDGCVASPLGAPASVLSPPAASLADPSPQEQTGVGNQELRAMPSPPVTNAALMPEAAWAGIAPASEVCSPSMSVSAEGSAYNVSGTGSLAGPGSAVIMEDDDAEADAQRRQLRELQLDADEALLQTGTLPMSGMFLSTPEAPAQRRGTAPSRDVPDEFQAWKASLVANSKARAEESVEVSTSDPVQGADAVPPPVEASPSAARLAWTTAELAACRDELNSAVYEAAALRRSEEAASEAAAAAEAPSHTFRFDEQASEALRARILELENRNAELLSENTAMVTRLASLEQRLQEVEAEMEARPFAPDSEFQKRMAEKDKQIDRLRVHADEATRELEARQETIDAMEARLQQAERAVLLPTAKTFSADKAERAVLRPTAKAYAAAKAPLNTVNVTTASLPTRLPVREARIDAAKAELQRLSQVANSPQASGVAAGIAPPSNGAVSLEDARARVKLLYDKLSTNESQASPAAEGLSNGSLSRGRTRVSAPAIGSRESSSTTRIPVVRAGSPGRRSDSNNGVRGPRVQLVNAWGEVKRLDAQVHGAISGASSLSSSYARTQASSPPPTQGSSPQGRLLGVSPSSHVEVLRLRHNVSELETLMTQMAGDKAGRGPASVGAPDSVYRLVGSHASSTTTQSPMMAPRVVEVSRAVSPVASPSGRFLQTRPSSPSPGSGGQLYYVAPPSSCPPSSLMSPSQQTRRSLSRTPPQSRAYSPHTVASNYLTQPSSSPSPTRPSIGTTLPVSRSASPAPIRSGQPMRETPTPMNMAAWLGRAG